jgi:hypothetical protein
MTRATCSGWSSAYGTDKAGGIWNQESVCHPLRRSRAVCDWSAACCRTRLQIATRECHAPIRIRTKTEWTRSGTHGSAATIGVLPDCAKEKPGTIPFSRQPVERLAYPITGARSFRRGRCPARAPLAYRGYARVPTARLKLMVKSLGAYAPEAPARAACLDSSSFNTRWSESPRALSSTSTW